MKLDLGKKEIFALKMKQCKTMWARYDPKLEEKKNAAIAVINAHIGFHKAGLSGGDFNGGNMMHCENEDGTMEWKRIDLGGFENFVRKFHLNQIFYVNHRIRRFATNHSIILISDRKRRKLDCFVPDSASTTFRPPFSTIRKVHFFI